MYLMASPNPKVGVPPKTVVFFSVAGIHSSERTFVKVYSTLCVSLISSKSFPVSESTARHFIMTVSFSESQYQYPPHDGSFIGIPLFIFFNASENFISCLLHIPAYSKQIPFLSVTPDRYSVATWYSNTLSTFLSSAACP